jgi:serine protease Do
VDSAITRDGSHYDKSTGVGTTSIAADSVPAAKNRLGAALLALATLSLVGTGLARAQQGEQAGLAAVAALEDAVVDAIAQAEKSVVAIARVRKDDPRPPMRSELLPPAPLELPLATDPTDPAFIPHEFATGVVIDAKGLIVTAYHALGDVKAAEFYVWANRKPYAARVKAADPWLDLAVLEIEADNLRPITLGNARALKKGQFVIALGNPYAIARDGQPSATWGLVSNLARQAPPPRNASRPSEGRETLHHWGTLIQTDARLELGTSGGALVNLRGEMVGLTASLAAMSGAERPGGFAYPVDDDFRRALDVLKTGQAPEYGFLGVAPRYLPVEDRQAGQRGALVEDIVPATPAAVAGLKSGDLITRVDDQEVWDDLELIRFVSGKQAGTIVSLTVERGRERGQAARGAGPLVIPVTLAKRRSEERRPLVAEVPPAVWRGMRVEYATAAPLFRERSRDLDPAGSVGVVEVQRDSLAWKAGLRPGDFVSHVGGRRVATPAEFHEAAAAEGEVVLELTAAGEKPERTVASP